VLEGWTNPYQVDKDEDCRKTSPTSTGLSKDSKAMAQKVRTLDKGRLAKTASGHVSADVMTQVDAALRLHLSL
jgi:mRNA-degrading endonuclease toxin of MazEF toxin-antitoxin module